MPSNTALGIAGFTFADLHQPARLRELYDRFVDEVKATEPELWAQWAAYREVPESLEPDRARQPDRRDGAARQPLRQRAVQRRRRRRGAGRRDARPTTTCSASRSTSSAAARCRCSRAARTSRRPPTITRSSSDPSAAGSPTHDRRELALARAGCALLDREAADKAASGSRSRRSAGRRRGDRVAEALVRAHVHDPRYRALGRSSASPRRSTTDTSCRCSGPTPALPEAMIGPDEQLRRRDGFKLTDARCTTREVLSEIHYCVLCHERDKDSCSKGIRDKDGAVTTNPLGIPLAGCPLDEKISEMHTAAEARRRDRRAGASSSSTTRCARAPATASATTA